ncbi:SH2 domain-containing protein 7 [Bufo gargarizans]|uniref:SH2 domain-containing protein 7 n=1 Tax=Bufo gargarizans TaxID=30331 RepID=UPI001CF51B24|nr:SH2 domain-containing protein 7 [Bufo gargarizans]
MSKNDKKGTLSRRPMEMPVMQGSDDGLPDWFHGIMSSRDCEELLKNKEIGHFIIRLSPRTFGYVLSYKGKDRCRHFVINQLSNGELVVSGDSYSHDSLPGLIAYYQNTPIEPFGEKLSLNFIKFSENNKYDNIQGPNSKVEKSRHNADNPKKNPHGQKKKTVANAQDIAPPLPERNRSLNTDDDDEQIYAKPKKETNGKTYSPSNNPDVYYSAQKDIVKTNPQNVLYSEVKFDNSLPSALGHLQGSSQEVDTRKSKLMSSLNELSGCEILEMRFATSIQTANSKTLSGQFIHTGAESPGSSFLFPADISLSEGEDIYAQIPFRDPHYKNEYHTVDKISNYSMQATNTVDHISTRISKEVTSREINKKVTHVSTAQDNLYETISTDFTKLPVRKQNAAKVEKQKRFLFGDKKK